jgi:hypothetical protein
MTTVPVVIVLENVSVLNISGGDGRAKPAHHPQRKILLRNFYQFYYVDRSWVDFLGGQAVKIARPTRLRKIK